MLQQPNSHDLRLPRLLEATFVVVIGLELIAPYVTHTLGVDGRLQMKMILEYNHLISSGIFIPTWTPEGFYHFGATTFYFYPPLTFYLSAIIYRVGVQNPMVLFQTVCLLMTIASFFSARWLLWKLGSSQYRANLAAALYAFAPLRIAELYMRSSIATHITYVFLPLICGALIIIFQEAKSFSLKRALLLGLTCSLTALTDVPIAVMVAIGGALAAIVIWKKLKWTSTFEVLIGLGIAGALAAYHFVSSVTAQSFSRLQDLHFPHRPSDILVYFHLGPGTYYMALLYAAAGIIALAYVWLKWKKIAITHTEAMLGKVGLTIAAFILYLDLFPISSIVWNHFPPLDLVQFPWRFYPLLLLLGVLLVGLAQSPILVRTARWVSTVWILGAILPIVLVVFSLHIFHPFERPLEDATEYLPIYFNPSIYANDDRTAVERALAPHKDDAPALGDLSSNENIQRATNAPYLETYAVSFRAPQPIVFHRFYWPFWHLYIGDYEIPSHPDTLGRAVATLPAGTYTATWKLERTPLETAGLWISGVGWVGVLLFYGIGLVRKRVRKRVTSSP